ncbi:hypothetical protein Acr_11g0003820 [Actinidia rufa]|uniref:Protein FAR1-RELATED SEQUENCE n=1 Tax=Actinidia rufa TaxID=165716 RepID=A0A7J0FCB5_9ERIC|nr:hypothetical protein Acr_11g0003820 [Actinidia rufa]
MEIEDIDLEENMNVEAVLEPKVGTIFNSENEAKEYYSTYAKAKGFGSVVKASKKRDDGWMLNSIELNHNHELDPEKAKYLKCYRTLPPHSQRAIELSMDVGIKLTPFIRACVIGEGGPHNVTWTEKDARNHKDKVRRSELKEGDAEAMHKYFVRMQEDNVPDKLKGYKEYKSIRRSIKSVVYDSLSAEEFEQSWENLIKQFDLQNNGWLAGLYEERHRWVPAFVKDTFWAGMSTTQRSESMNAFFDGYVHSNTSLKEFVEQYDNALRKKVQQEEEGQMHVP